jgi:hypothetical protein
VKNHLLDHDPLASGTGATTAVVQRNAHATKPCCTCSLFSMALLQQSLPLSRVVLAWVFPFHPSMIHGCDASCPTDLLTCTRWQRNAVRSCRPKPKQPSLNLLLANPSWHRLALAPLRDTARRSPSVPREGHAARAVDDGALARGGRGHRGHTPGRSIRAAEPPPIRRRRLQLHANGPRAGHRAARGQTGP